MERSFTSFGILLFSKSKYHHEIFFLKKKLSCCWLFSPGMLTNEKKKMFSSFFMIGSLSLSAIGSVFYNIRLFAMCTESRLNLIVSWSSNCNIIGSLRAIWFFCVYFFRCSVRLLLLVLLLLLLLHFFFLSILPFPSFSDFELIFFYLKRCRCVSMFARWYAIPVTWIWCNTLSMRCEHKTFEQKQKKKIIL